MWDACRKINRSDTRVSLLRFGYALHQSTPKTNVLQVGDGVCNLQPHPHKQTDCLRN